MKCVDRMGPILLLSLAVFSCFCFTLAIENSGQNVAPAQRSAVGKFRALFKMPKLFNFELYEKYFNKKYKSLAEKAARAKLFFGRAFKVFIAACQYKFGRASKYLAINELSDLTESERKQLYKYGGESKPPVQDNDHDKKEEEAPAADLNEIEDKLNEIVANKDQNAGYAKIAAELEQSGRKRRDLSDQQATRRGQLSIDDLMKEPDESESIPQEDSSQVDSSNPNSVSDSEASDQRLSRSPSKLARDYAEIVAKKGLQFLSRIVQPVKNYWSAINTDVADISLPDEVFLDYRKSGCIYKSKIQHLCGACYIFSILAVYEYHYCKQNGGELLPFSEQYVVDCGSRMGNHGCDGGFEETVAAFVDQFGLEQGKQYPYRAKDGECPYSSELSRQAMGYVRVEGTNMTRIRALSRENIAIALEQFGPMVIAINVNEDFEDYGGGVDKLEGCRWFSGHAMTLVGHGREDGLEYWLIKNSFGKSWGREGYYKLSKEIHQVRGLSGSGRIELPCLVDQLNCGEVYYITWTKSANTTSGAGSSLQQQQQQWTRVYLYTGANDSAPHKPIGDLVNRAEFLMPDRRSQGLADDEDRAPPMARLVIEQPRLSDEAVYKCDVTYVKGKCPSISLVRVQMMALPSKAQLSLSSNGGNGGGGGNGARLLGGGPAGAAANQLAEGQLIGPLNEHEQLRLTCQVFGGRPQPKSVIWRKIDPSGRTINLQHEQTSRATTTSGRNAEPQQQQQPMVEVHLNHTLTSADLGAKFECHVEHEALERPLLARSLANGGAMRPAPSLALSEDSMLDLHPSKSIQEESMLASGGSLDQSTLKQSLDSHVFVDLNVGVASLDLFMSKLNKRNSSEPLKEGDLVELECVAYNSKPPANITWFNGAESIEQLATNEPPSSSSTSARSRHKRLLQRNQINRNNDGQTYNTHSFLSIKLSRHEHRAQISCQAQNGPSTAQPLSKSLELQVQHAPIVLMEPAGGIVVNEQQQQPTSARIGSGANSGENNVIAAAAAAAAVAAPASAPSSTVSIYCIYSANPSELVPNSTRWFKDGQQLQNVMPAAAAASTTDQHLTESLTATGYPVLNINRVSRQDAGRYDCQLSNAVGVSERLPTSEASRLEVNFRPLVRLRVFKPSIATSQARAHFSMDDLVELDIERELILAGGTYVLVCDVLEARPAKIEKFHWFRKQSVGNSPRAGDSGIAAAATTTLTRPPQLIGATEAGQFVLGSLAANFSPTSYACSALNALGPSEPSNQVEMQLSYSPGPSAVRPNRDAALLKQLQQSGELTRTSFARDNSDAGPHSQAALVAGQKILLECATPDPGQPRANAWLWFKNGQPIDSKSFARATNPSMANYSGDNTDSNYNNNRDLILDDNPISGQDLSPIQLATGDSAKTFGPMQRRNHHSSSKNDVSATLPFHENEETSSITDNSAISSERDAQLMRMKLLGSGRYLFIPSIQLAHKGNYSCVALNRFGSGPQQSPNQMERESYRLDVALAPSFVQPLPPRTYWAEISSPANERPSQTDGQIITELVCHVQCDPMCAIEWLRDGQPIDLKSGKSLESGGYGSNYVTYQIRQTILDENLEANLFKSIESRLVLKLNQHAVFDRERVLARRSYLNGSNYTCQSAPNSMGPAVRSTSKLVVQYPPENVLINAPSDKLSLVEGSNGPRLSCEASGEPQVQYRWLLSKVGGTDLAASKYNQVKRSSPVAARAGTGATIDSVGEQDHAINQMGSAKGWIEPPRGANDASVGNSLSQEESLIELTGSISEQRGGSPDVTISTLDMGNLSLDRRQTGHYICEASNSLGQSRQSVYVNVLYKPTCSSLHLHSLDMLMAPSQIDATKQPDGGEMRIKPLKASANDEYSLVRETSEDFINLRKTLVISPLLNGHLSPMAAINSEHRETAELSLKGSIFQAILDDKFSSSASRPSDGKEKDALIHSDDNDIGVENNILSSHHQELKRPSINRDSLSNLKSKNGDAWDRFNSLLLKFLNNYMKQVKNNQDEQTNRSPQKESSRDKRQNSRGSSVPTNTDRLSRADSEPLYRVGDTSDRNLLTFVCMAQDGNPMGNLTFDWSFGAVNLPESTDSIELDSRRVDLVDDNATVNGLSSSKPLLVYTNTNYTVSVVLVRRLDTHTTLSPFQMSLLTLNVIVDRQSSVEDTIEAKIEKRNADSFNSQGPVPVIRNRIYTSSYGGSRVNKNTQQNSNIQFANEFEARPSSSGSAVELDEHNWQEQLGNLLKCRVSNQIGTSDVCHVRVNLAERLKSLSSTSEFARWRMPSLAQKSLLIVSILVGCALIVFSASALLIGPYLRERSYKSSDTVHESGENNTRQSTSSQKSSVLGLLTNGDSSIQGSSDEDSNGRSNHTEDNGPNSRSIQPLDLGSASLSGIVSNAYHTSGHNHYQSGQMMRDNLMANYDKPRRLHNHPATYQNGAFNERTPDQISNKAPDASQYLESLALSGGNKAKKETNMLSNTVELSRANQPSTGSKLLASLKLKSLAKFKVDKISDQANRASHLADLKSYHIREASGSGTNTTGLSNLCLDSDMSLSMTPPNAPNSVSKYFGSPAFRHSYTSARRPNNYISNQSDNYRYDRPALQPMHDPRVAQLSNQRFTESRVNSMMPTYSNLNNFDSYNAMDEFIRKKELESSIDYNRSTFDGSHSSFQHQSQMIPLPSQNQHDLNNMYSPQMTRGQPYYLAQQSMTLQRSNITDTRPPVAARPHRRLITADPLQYQMPAASNRYSMPASSHVPMINSSMGLPNTIDSHLDRLTGSLAAGQYLDSSNFAPPTTSSNGLRQLTQNIYSNSYQSNPQSTEHIYDVNAYATPERTPQRGQNITSSNDQDMDVSRPRVSQLIQTFNSSLPE